MKIAIPYENGQVFQHFGHSAQFKLYTAEEGRITGAEVVSTDGQGHGALVGFLVRNGVNVLLCGGIGGGAQMALAQAGIRLCGGITGDATALQRLILPARWSLTQRPLHPPRPRGEPQLRLSRLPRRQGRLHRQLPLRAVPLSGGTILNALRLRSGHKLRKKYL